MEAFFRSARRPSRSSEWTLEDAARFAALKEGYLLQFLSTHKKAFATARRLGLPLLQSQPLPPSAAEGGQQRRRPPRNAPSGLQPPVGCSNASSSQRGSTRPASRPPRQPPATAPAPAISAASAVVARDAGNTSCGTDVAPVMPLNARKRRSAARSAQRHTKRQRAIRSLSLILLFVTRLRRRVRRRNELDDLREEIVGAGLDPSTHTPHEISFALRETDVPPPNLAIRLGSHFADQLLAKRGRAGASSSSSSSAGWSSSSGGVGVAMDHGLAPSSSTRRSAKRGGGSRWGPALLR